MTEDEPIIWGLDVARFGSAASVLCKRQGRKILAMQTWRGLDLMQLTGAVVSEFESCLPQAAARNHLRGLDRRGWWGM